MNGISDKIKEFFEDISTDAVEERVIEYVIRELENGRTLHQVLDDPYVKNRLNQERLAHVLENTEVIGALEEAIAASFKQRDFGFGD